MCEQGSKLTQVRLAHTTKSLKTHALVDPCIARIIQMFNDEGYQTVASCCGHGKRPGVITLENGTELILCYSYKQTRMVESLYPGLHEEMDGKTPPPMNVDDYAKLVNELEGKNDHFEAFIKELGEENAELVKKRAIDQEKMEQQWEKIQDLDSDRDALIYDRNHLKDRISELITDRDGQKAGWDASVKVIDKFIVELDDQRKENDDLRKDRDNLKDYWHNAGKLTTWDQLLKHARNLEEENAEMTKTIDVLRDGHTQEELNTIQDCKTEIEKLKKDLACCQESEGDLANLLNRVEAECTSLKVTLSALRTASRFKKEYDPKWQNKVRELEEVILKNQEKVTYLKADGDRIHGHWHRQTSGYMNKIKNQRRQLKEYQKHSHRLTERMNTLFPYIAHGGKDHRKWLRNAIDRHFDMSRPDLKPKLGMETKTFSQGGFFKKGDI